MGAEWRKLTTTRSIYLLLGGVAALAIVTVMDPGYEAAEFGKPFHEHTFVLFTSLLSRILIFVLGVRVITDEFRHGTIVPSLLSSPRRGRLLAAKAFVAAAAGAVLGAVAWGAMTGAAAVAASSGGATLALDAGAWRSFGGMTLAGAGWALVGLGVGAIVRSQVVAIVGGLIWLMGLEDGLRGWFGDLAGYLPGQAGLALTTSPTARGTFLAAAILTGYAAVALAIGTRALRRDVS